MSEFGSPLVVRKVYFDTKVSVSEGERAVIARISTMSVDRDGDVMLPSGVDLTDFNQNPVVLFGHDSSRIPVGKAVHVQRRSRDILAKVIFASRPAEHPDSQEWVPDTLLAMFQQDMLRGFSVGFTVDDARPASKRDVARHGAGVRQIITKWKLVEFSVVPVPANQDALVQAVSKGILHQHGFAHNEMEFSSMEDVTPMFVVETPQSFIIQT